MRQKIIKYYDEDNLKKFCEAYLDMCSKLTSTIEDYHKNNTFVHNMITKDTEKIFLYIMRDTKKRKKYVDALFLENENIKSMIACYCLRYGIYRLKSKSILKKIRKTSVNKILKFNAEMALKEYGLFYKNKFEMED